MGEFDWPVVGVLSLLFVTMLEVADEYSNVFKGYILVALGIVVGAGMVRLSPQDVVENKQATTDISPAVTASKVQSEISTPSSDHCSIHHQYLACLLDECPCPGCTPLRRWPHELICTDYGYIFGSTCFNELYWDSPRL